MYSFAAPSPPRIPKSSVTCSGGGGGQGNKCARNCQRISRCHAQRTRCNHLSPSLHSGSQPGHAILPSYLQVGWRFPESVEQSRGWAQSAPTPPPVIRSTPRQSATRPGGQIHTLQLLCLSGALVAASSIPTLPQLWHKPVELGSSVCLSARVDATLEHAHCRSGQLRRRTPAANSAEAQGLLIRRPGNPDFCCCRIVYRRRHARQS